MRTRLYLPGTSDAQALDSLLGPGHSVLINRDRIVCALGPSDTPAAALVWRPCAFVHQFHLPHTLAQRTVATDLYAGAMTIDWNRKHRIRQAAFIIDSDNGPMLRFVQGLGAVEQYGKVFLLDLKVPVNENFRPSGQRVTTG